MFLGIDFSWLDLPWIALTALLIVVIASCFLRINPGVLAIVLAWIVGVYIRPYYDPALTPKKAITDVLSGFPVNLFLTLVGATLLFTQAQLNGTLPAVAKVAVRGCRGNVGMIPIMYFLVTMIFSSIGAGNIAGAAFMAPLAMATAERARIPAFLMFIMVAHGALAGALSPFAPTGIIANDILEKKLQVTGLEWKIYWNNLIANVAVAFGGYFLFGGWRLFSRKLDDGEPGASAPGVNRDAPEGAIREGASAPGGVSSELAAEAADEGLVVSTVPPPLFTRQHWITLGVIAALIVAVVGFDVDIGIGAFAGAMLLTLLHVADENEAIKKMPWGVIVMVCGVTMLTALLDDSKTGGLARFVAIMKEIATEYTLIPILTFLCGVISVYSSTSGVVLPAFLPMVPGLVKEIGGNAVALASSIIVGGHLVDSSPLSTIGALCIAPAPMNEDRSRLFSRALIWGLSMAVVGALVCFVFFGLLGL